MSDLSENNINFVDITNYAEARKIFNCSFEKFLALVKIQADINSNDDNIIIDNQSITHDNINKSILEILISPLVRMYFDIENIPNEDIFFEIVNKLIELYDLPKNYAYTKNNNSTHEGLSYHLYFPIKAYKNDIYLLVKDFALKTEYKYIKYIDYRVYGKNRLFRVIGSKCPGKVGYKRNINDFHNLIKGNVEDTIIQNIKDLNQFNYTFENIDFVESKYSEKISEIKEKKFSDHATKTWDMFKYPYPNFIEKTYETINNVLQSQEKQLNLIKENQEKQLNLIKEKQDKEFEIQKIKELQKLEKIKWENQLKQNKDEIELKRKEIELLKLQLELEKEKRLNNEKNNKKDENNK